MGFLEQFTVEPDIRDGIGWLRLIGRFVAETRHELRAGIRDWEAARVPLHVIALMRGVDYMDSAGMAALIGLWKHQQDIGGELVVAELNTQLQSIFQKASLGKIVKSFETREEAVEYLQNLAATAKKAWKPR